jgi:lipoprotein-releasing system ATP-binding protein
MPDVLLKLSAINKSYPAAAGLGSRMVLRDLSLQLADGDSIAIVGPSGSGKSTLLNLIGSLDRPTSGEILFDGQDLTSLNDEELSNLRRHKIGFIFQQHHLLPQCTVLENVLLPTLARKTPLDRAADLLRRVGLSDYLEQRPVRLSGGEQQRVAVVRALINQPKLLLADEPTGSLDQAASENLGKLLVELNQENGVALVVVTHSLKLAGKMQKAYELVNGNLMPQAV